DRYTRYLDCYDEHHRQRYRVERADTLQPGTYRLTCAARANGTGAFIYAMLGDGQPQFMEIPATGNTGGDIWVEADKFHHYHKDIPIPSDSVPYGHEQCELWDVNNHRGFGWNRITFEPIHVTTPTILRYGLTSDDAFTGSTWLGQWFSATDFEVSRVEN
nr:PspC family transcriptional regulator [Bacteroidales bacterium]